MARKEVEKNVNTTNIQIINILFGINSGDGKNVYFR